MMSNQKANQELSTLQTYEEQKKNQREGNWICIQNNFMENKAASQLHLKGLQFSKKRWQNWQNINKNLLMFASWLKS